MYGFHFLYAMVHFYCHTFCLIVNLKLFCSYGGTNVGSKMWFINSGISLFEAMWTGCEEDGPGKAHKQTETSSCFVLLRHIIKIHMHTHADTHTCSAGNKSNSSELKWTSKCASPSDINVSRAVMTDRRSIHHHHSPLPPPLMCPQVIPVCSVCIHKGSSGGVVSSGNETE